MLRHAADLGIGFCELCGRPRGPLQEFPWLGRTVFAESDVRDAGLACDVAQTCRQKPVKRQLQVDPLATAKMNLIRSVTGVAGLVVNDEPLISRGVVVDAVDLPADLELLAVVERQQCAESSPRRT